ncbi:MAG: extracellular solute-binding protein, partial [Cetobacterium sp.]
YGIPFDSGVTGLFYRKDYLKEAGISEEKLQNITWNELIEIGKEIKLKTGKQLMGNGMDDSGLVRVMMQSAGSWYFNDKGEVDFLNNDVLKESILTVKNMYNSGLVNNTSGWANWVSNFTSGDVATLSTGAWIIGSIKTEASQSGKWGVAPIPRLSNSNSVNASNLGGSSWYILNKNNKEVAAKFMKDIFATDKEFYNEILTERGAIGTFLPSQNTASYEKADEFFDNQKVYSDFSNWMKQIPAVNYGVYVTEADQAIVSVLKDIIEDKISLEEGLQKAENQLKSQIQ